MKTFCVGNLKLMVAAGPFFTESSPHGKLLKSFIQKTADLDAQLLILLGPMFDADFGVLLNRRTSESIQQCYDEVLDSVLKPLFKYVTSYICV